MHRRELITRALALGGLATFGPTLANGRLAADPVASRNAGTPRPNPIGVSTYSFWRFQDEWKLSIPECISRSADMGFDFVEILEMQMEHYTVAGKTVAGKPLVRPDRA